MQRRRRRSFTNNDDHELLDLTSAGTTGPEARRRKMRPPGVSNRTDYSYEDNIESSASIQFIGDSADNDIAVATDVFNAKRYTPSDPEGEERSMADMLDVSDKGQGIQSGAEEVTYYPASNKFVSKRLI